MQKRQWCCALLLLGAVPLLSGCNMFGGGGLSALNPLVWLQNDPPEIQSEDAEDWDFVGKEARGDRPRERDVDSWWKKYIMSDKANAIERNLGID